MKKLSFHLLVLTGILGLSTSCSDDSSQSVTNIQPVIDTVADGTWKITYYMDSNSDHTAQFSGYTFTFGTSNALTATNGTNTYAGMWSVTNSSGSDDNSHDDDSSHSEDIDFNISFASPLNFTELSDDWDIVSFSSTKIQLIDVSGGNGGTDYLTFEKN